jgi:hypothetical protein
LGAKGDQGPRGEQGPMGAPGQLYTPTGTTATIVAGSVATAPSDSTRLITGTNAVCGTAPRTQGCFLQAGPFVLTDARALERSSVTWFFTVPVTGDCSAVTCNLTLFGPFPTTDVQVLAVLSLYRSTDTEFPNQMTGARYFVGADRRLCACGPNALYNEPWRVSWAGFVPYQ